MKDLGATVNPRAALDKDIRTLRGDLIRMGDLVDKSITRATTSLRDRDVVRAKKVVEEDLLLNDKRFRIEEKCLHIIAAQQPAASDLREIVAVMNMVSDLERMGDHAAGIAKMVLRMDTEASEGMPPGLEQMSESVRGMLHRAMDAYANYSIMLAYEVASQDDLIDAAYRALFRRLLEMMANKPEMTTQALFYLFAGHNFERIGDRVTNLAERVIFLGSGRMQELNPEPDESGTN